VDGKTDAEAAYEVEVTKTIMSTYCLITFLVSGVQLANSLEAMTGSITAFALGQPLAGALLFASSVNSAILSSQANNGYQWVRDYVMMYNERLLNTATGSDSFVPEPSSTFSLSKFGGTAISPDGKFVQDYPDDNHASIAYNPKIWGDKGSFGNIQPGGLVDIWLRNRQIQIPYKEPNL
jgi:hypothetical protein